MALFDGTSGFLNIIDENGDSVGRGKLSLPWFDENRNMRVTLDDDSVITGRFGGFTLNGLRMSGVTGQSAPQVGGVEIGATGEAGTVYEGYSLAWGDDFETLDILGPTNESGYITSRGVLLNDGVRNGATAAHYYTDPLHTGYLDSGRGTPPITDTMTIEAGTRLKLKARKATAGEQAGFAASSYTGGKPVITAAAISSPRQIVFYVGTAGGEIITEAKIRHTPKADSPAGWHPTFWTLSSTPTYSYDGDEFDIGEGNSQLLYFNRQVWNTGTATGTQMAAGLDFMDGLDHIYTLVQSRTSAKLYIDGNLIVDYATDCNSKNKPAYLILTSLPYIAGAYEGENFVEAQWTASANGASLECDWLRIWSKEGVPHLTPLVEVSDVNVAYNGTTTITLPSKADLWGDATVDEYVQVIMGEANDPTNGTAFVQFPAGVSYNSTTREITVDWSASATNPGRLLLNVQAYKATGSTCEPLNINVNRGPKLTTTAKEWIEDEAIDALDIYAAVNVGNLIPTSGKITSVSGLPAGLSYDSGTGLITGTPTTVSSGNIAVSGVNSVGQTVSGNIPYEVVAASSAVAVPAPTLTDSPTLIASWDFGDDTKITNVSGAISAIAGSDGTSVTLSQGTSSKRPVLTVLDGKQAAEFTSVSQQFLQAVDGLGSPANVSAVVICVPKVTTAFSLLDISRRASTVSTARHLMIASVSTLGLSWRKCSDTGANSNAYPNVAWTTTPQLVIGQSPTGTAYAKIFRNGAASGHGAAAPAANPTLLTHTTLGADASSNAENRYADMYVYRVLIYAADLTPTQREEIAVWAATHYGTPNLA
jgi:hypothetical protein